MGSGHYAEQKPQKHVPRHNIRRRRSGSPDSKLSPSPASWLQDYHSLTTKRFASESLEHNRPQNQDRMSLRGEDRSWYIFSRAVPIENDNFLSDKTLRASLRDIINLEKPDLWITDAWRFLDDKGMRQSNLGLIVSLVKEHQNTKYARSELHVTIGLQSCFRQELLEMVYQVVRHLSESLPAQQLAEFDQYEVNLAAPAWRSAFQALEFEMHSIAKCIALQEARKFKRCWQKPTMALRKIAQIFSISSLHQSTLASMDA
ncbi:hypothetical protein ABVK25_004480 [Lepraria finkii]|uniref:Uncharacterized protein n=1 Tax=Lepraria finkii TaxID=1340010 RepID=A0ABR4BCJ0_9LECA